MIVVKVPDTFNEYDFETHLEYNKCFIRYIQEVEMTINFNSSFKINHLNIS